ncbi:hypothetical protein KP509_19G067400 [Ceratopteris richardii]|uniref:Cytochrome P450 n=1 Tax=Ceratopteris richardii TaxID=49495 RepID=A0A8T2SPE8_CERRI|nr:hypothetical protein KP509_19G067400 [Ceratopteris richardii]
MFVATILIRKARMNLPPSPPGLPIIGHHHLLGSRPVRSLSDLSRRYGSLMFLRFGNVPVLVASSPAADRLISKMRSHISCSPTIPVVSFEREELLSAPPGLYFKFHHRLRTAELFSAKPFHFFQPIINDEIRSLLQVVADNAACVHIRKELYDATFSIISRIAISRRAKDLRSPSQSDHSSSLQNLLIDSIDLLGVQNIGDYKPCLAWMDLQGARRAKAISTKIKSMWQQIIDDRRRTRLTRGSEIKDSDFLDVLLTASAQDDLQLSDLAIKAVLTGKPLDGRTVTPVLTAPSNILGPSMGSSLTSQEVFCPPSHPQARQPLALPPLKQGTPLPPPHPPPPLFPPPPPSSKAPPCPSPPPQARRPLAPPPLPPPPPQARPPCPPAVLALSVVGPVLYPSSNAVPSFNRWTLPFPIRCPRALCCEHLFYVRYKFQIM